MTRASDMPFQPSGGMQSGQRRSSLDGPFGGTYTFQQYRTEMRAYAPLGQIGGKAQGSEPMKFVLGLSGRAGVVTGDPGPFFFSQEFSLGGVQYGEQLRGYQEFSITPQGYVPGPTTSTLLDCHSAMRSTRDWSSWASA